MEARLQIVCLVIIMYISVIYIKETSGKMKVSCNCLFDAILAIAPWAVVFDGFSAITVNHRDAINANINLFAHGMFFLCMNLVIIVSFFYMLDITIGRPKRLKTILYLMPGIISIVLMLLYLPKLEFIKGSFTDYSMGTSVYISFLSFTFYYGAMLAIMFIHRKTVESKKWYSMLFIIVIAFLTLIVQYFANRLLSLLLILDRSLHHQLCAEGLAKEKIHQ